MQWGGPSGLLVPDEIFSSGDKTIKVHYLVIIERSDTSWGAYVPDLPGCVAVADSRFEVVELIREAIDFHVEGMRMNGELVPEPSSEGELIEVGA